MPKLFFLISFGAGLDSKVDYELIDTAKSFMIENHLGSCWSLAMGIKYFLNFKYPLFFSGAKT